jgi:adenosylcobyric acid synthase
MSNNAAVCLGGEIGRAQAMQAYASKVEPTVDMNPILLKPEADSHSQVIVRGKVWGTLSAKEYLQCKNELWESIIQSFNKLRDSADIVFIEGAGSAAELNLKSYDIVNFAIAKYAHSPCVLVGDIDRGGIFSQLLGTHYLLEDDERRLLVGFIVNKFRGTNLYFGME